MPDDARLGKERLHRRRFAHSPSAFHPCLWVKSTASETLDRRHYDPSAGTTGRFRAVNSMAVRAHAPKQHDPVPVTSKRSKELKLWFVKGEPARPPRATDEEATLMQLLEDVPGLMRVIEETIAKAREHGIVGEIGLNVTSERPPCVLLSLPAPRAQRSELLRAIDNWLVAQPLQAHRRLIVDTHEP